MAVKKTENTEDLSVTIEFRATVLSKLDNLESRGQAIETHLEKLNGKVAEHEKYVTESKAVAKVKDAADVEIAKVKEAARVAAEKVQEREESHRDKFKDRAMPVVYFALLVVLVSALTNAPVLLKMLGR